MTSIALTYHVRVAFLRMELREVILVGVKAKVVATIHSCVVVSEEEPRRIGLVDVIVEVASAGYRHRIPVQAMYYQPRLVMAWPKARFTDTVEGNCRIRACSACKVIEKGGECGQRQV